MTTLLATPPAHAGYGIIEKSTSLALVHPIVMGVLFLGTVYAGYTGLTWRKAREIGDEIRALKKATPATTEDEGLVSSTPPAVAARLSGVRASAASALSLLGCRAVLIEACLLPSARGALPACDMAPRAPRDSASVGHSPPLALAAVRWATPLKGCARTMESPRKGEVCPSGHKIPDAPSAGPRAPRPNALRASAAACKGESCDARDAAVCVPPLPMAPLPLLP